MIISILVTSILRNRFFLEMSYLFLKLFFWFLSLRRRYRPDDEGDDNDDEDDDDDDDEGLTGLKLDEV